MNRPKPAARGDFSKTPLAHLLIYALEKKLTGSMEFTAPDGRSGALTLIEGHVTNARTSEPVAHLGRVLADLGFITDDTLNRTLLAVAQSKRLHGQILLEQKAVTEDQLRDGLKAQLLRKLRHMFGLPPDSIFVFYDAFDVLHGFGGDAVSMTDPLPVIWRAVCETPPWEHVHGTLSRMQNTRLRVVKSATLQRFDFEKDVVDVIERIRRQPMRVSEITALGLVSPRITQLLVYTLLITKQLEGGEVLASSPPPPVPRPVSIPPVARTPRPPAPSVHGFSQSVVPPAPRSSDPGASTGPSASISSTGDRPSGRLSSPPQMPTSMPRAPNVPSFAKITPAFPVTQTNRVGSALDRTPSPAIPAQGSQLSPELTERRIEIKSRSATIDKQDYFEMLGVKRDATPDVVQTAFFTLAKRWHPDRLPKELEAVREEAQRVFARLGEAHQTLMDADRRGRYMRLLNEGGATPDEQETIAAVIDASQNFQRAEIFMKRNDLAQAEILCRKAYEADKQQADYLALLAWLESMKPENQTPKGSLERIAMLDRAVQLNQNCERAYFYRGMLHKKLSNAPSAMRDFRRAAELNPRNVDAAREVRLFEMRKGRVSTAPPPSHHPPITSSSHRTVPHRNSSPPEKSGGLLGKLFKK